MSSKLRWMLFWGGYIRRRLELAPLGFAFCLMLLVAATAAAAFGPRAWWTNALHLFNELTAQRTYADLALSLTPDRDVVDGGRRVTFLHIDQKQYEALGEPPFADRNLIRRAIDKASSHGAAAVFLDIDLSILGCDALFQEGSDLAIADERLRDFLERYGGPEDRFMEPYPRNRRSQLLLPEARLKNQPCPRAARAEDNAEGEPLFAKPRSPESTEIMFDEGWRIARPRIRFVDVTLRSDLDGVVRVVELGGVQTEKGLQPDTCRVVPALFKLHEDPEAEIALDCPQVRIQDPVRRQAFAAAKVGVIGAALMPDRLAARPVVRTGEGEGGAWAAPAYAIEDLDYKFFKDRVVVIGQTHSAITDLIQTPFGPMPGSMLLANAVHSAPSLADVGRAGVGGQIAVVLIALVSAIFVAIARLVLRSGYAAILSAVVFVGAVILVANAFGPSSLTYYFACGAGLLLVWGVVTSAVRGVATLLRRDLREGGGHWLFNLPTRRYRLNQMSVAEDSE